MTASANQLLPAGKLPSALLARLLAGLPTEHPQLLLGPAVGEDAAVIDLEFGPDQLLVAKSDPITFATDEIGYYAVNVCANDLAVTGATPRFYLPTLLLPANQTDVALAERIFQQIGAACRQLEIVVVGGHSEITTTVNQPVVAGTMLGEVQRSAMIASGGAQPGDLVLMAGCAPVEGVSIIAREMRTQLLATGWSIAEVDEAANYLYQPGISIQVPALAAAPTGVVTAMHDPTEGGVITGLHELATAALVGLAIDLEAIPIPPLARRLCAAFGLDPLGTIASGALLAAVRADYAEVVLSVWQTLNWPATIIGQVLPLQAGVTAFSGGQRIPLPIFPVDEITKLWSHE